MAHFSIEIPSEFMKSLDELVMQSGAGTRELWLRNTIGNMLIQYQVQKDFAPQLQRRTIELTGLWA
jgi:metal-responsive CopG/Arc/MetJ family transcriptional regulator